MAGPQQPRVPESHPGGEMHRRQPDACRGAPPRGSAVQCTCTPIVNRQHSKFHVKKQPAPHSQAVCADCEQEGHANQVPRPRHSRLINGTLTNICTPTRRREIDLVEQLSPMRSRMDHPTPPTPCFVPPQKCMRARAADSGERTCKGIADLRSSIRRVGLGADNTITDHERRRDSRGAESHAADSSDPKPARAPE